MTWCDMTGVMIRPIITWQDIIWHDIVWHDIWHDMIWHWTQKHMTCQYMTRLMTQQNMTWIEMTCYMTIQDIRCYGMRHDITHVTWNDMKCDIMQLDMLHDIILYKTEWHGMKKYMKCHEITRQDMTCDITYDMI